MTAPFCRYLKKALLRLLHFAVSVYVLLLLLLDPRSILNDDFEGTLNMVSKKQWVFYEESFVIICGSRE